METRKSPAFVFTASVASSAPSSSAQSSSQVVSKCQTRAVAQTTRRSSATRKAPVKTFHPAANSEVIPSYNGFRRQLRFLGSPAQAKPSTFVEDAASRFRQKVDSATHASSSGGIKMSVEYKVNISQEKAPKSTVELEIEVPGEMTKQFYDQSLQHLSSKLNLKGFRKGKVPSAYLEGVNKQHLKALATEAIVNAGCDLAIDQAELRAVDRPVLVTNFDELSDSLEPEKPLKFKAKVEVWPTVELGPYAGMTIKAEKVELNLEAETMKTIEEYRKKIAPVVTVLEARPAKDGDTVVIDFKGFERLEDGSRGAPDESINEIEFQVELSPGKFVKGFVEGIVGMSPDETKDIPVTFDDKYPAEEVRGRKLIFEVTLKEIKEKELPPLDDELAAKISEEKTLDDLKRLLTTRFERELKTANEAKEEKAVLRALSAVTTVEVPDALIREQTKHSFRVALGDMQRQGYSEKQLNELITKEKYAAFARQTRPSVVKSLVQDLAVTEVAKRESLALTPDEVETELALLRPQFKDTPNYDEDQLKRQVESVIEKKKVVEWMVANNKMEYGPPGSFPEIEEEEFEEQVPDSGDDMVFEDIEDEAWMFEEGLFRNTEGKAVSGQA